jgi:hypothetical protein
MKIFTLKRILSFVAAWALATLSPLHGADAKAKAEEEAKAIHAMLEPGQIATSADGFVLKAKIDGKEWIATAMRSPERTGRIIGYNGDESISLPYHRTYLTAGKTIKFGENRGVDLFLKDEVGSGAVYQGQ